MDASWTHTLHVRTRIQSEERADIKIRLTWVNAKRPVHGRREVTRRAGHGGSGRFTGQCWTWTPGRCGHTIATRRTENRYPTPRVRLRNENQQRWVPGAPHSPRRTQDRDGLLSEQTAPGAARPTLPRSQSTHYLLKHLEKGLGGVCVLTLSSCGFLRSNVLCGPPVGDRDPSLKPTRVTGTQQDLLWQPQASRVRKPPKGISDTSWLTMAQIQEESPYSTHTPRLSGPFYPAHLAGVKRVAQGEPGAPLLFQCFCELPGQPPLPH